MLPTTINPTKGKLGLLLQTCSSSSIYSFIYKMINVQTNFFIIEDLSTYHFSLQLLVLVDRKSGSCTLKIVIPPKTFKYVRIKSLFLSLNLF